MNTKLEELRKLEDEITEKRKAIRGEHLKERAREVKALVKRYRNLKSEIEACN